MLPGHPQRVFTATPSTHRGGVNDATRFAARTLSTAAIGGGIPGRTVIGRMTRPPAEHAMRQFVILVARLAVRAASFVGGSRLVAFAIRARGR
jgi:hypothetical protein